MPKISVLMPVYKTPEPFLREAVESILNQTAENFEFLILDDCPEDRAAEAVIASYDDARIKYFRNERNLGIAGSRNRLMEMATGDYLAVADHDDVSLPQRLEKKQPIWTRIGNAASFPGGISFCAGNGGASGGGRSIMRKSARRWRKGAPSFIRRACCEGRNWSASGYDMRSVYAGGRLCAVYAPARQDGILQPAGSFAAVSEFSRKYVAPAASGNACSRRTD